MTLSGIVYTKNSKSTRKSREVRRSPGWTSVRKQGKPKYLQKHTILLFVFSSVRTCKFPKIINQITLIWYIPTKLKTQSPKKSFRFLEYICLLSYVIFWSFSYEVRRFFDPRLARCKNKIHHWYNNIWWLFEFFFLKFFKNSLIVYFSNLNFRIELKYLEWKTWLI